ncbi:hypothetical protein F9222_23510 [Escherichia coli]|nr:hypothetical protein F9222_23510 [Escherichia coli]
MTGDEIWANCASKDMRTKIQDDYYDNIVQVINQTNAELQDMGVSFSNSALSAELNEPERLMAHTMSDKGGYLWSPKGLCAHCEPQIDFDSLSKKDQDNLLTFCDTIFNCLRQELNLNLDKNEGSYAVLEAGHYTWYKKLDV